MLSSSATVCHVLAPRGTDGWAQSGVSVVQRQSKSPAAPQHQAGSAQGPPWWFLIPHGAGSHQTPPRAASRIAGGARPSLGCAKSSQQLFPARLRLFLDHFPAAQFAPAFGDRTDCSCGSASWASRRLLARLWQGRTSGQQLRAGTGSRSLRKPPELASRAQQSSSVCMVSLEHHLSPALGLQQDKAELVTQDHVQTALEYLQGRRVHSLSGQPVPTVHSLSRLKKT